MRKILYIAVGLFLLTSCGGGRVSKEPTDSINTADSILTTDSIVGVVGDSIAEEQAAEVARLNSIRQDSIAKVEKMQHLREVARNQYVETLRKTDKQYTTKYGSGWIDYFLYDITKDGIPELWLIHGTCEADRALSVYTPKEDGLKKIYEDGAGHSEFHKGKNYVLQVMGHQGYACWLKLTYNGSKISQKMTFEENCYETERDYTEPKEPVIRVYEVDNLKPVYSAFSM